MAKIPSDNHIRDMLDPADPALLHPAFAEAVDHLAQCKGGTEYLHAMLMLSRRRRSARAS